MWLNATAFSIAKKLPLHFFTYLSCPPASSGWMWHLRLVLAVCSGRELEAGLHARHMASSHIGSQDESETALLDALDATDEYLRHQHALAMALKDGYLNISRARYSMGATSIGESHYASEMDPLLHIVAAGKDCSGQPEWRLERRACSEKLAGRPAGRDNRAGAAAQGAESASEEVPACDRLHAAPPRHVGGGSSTDGAAEAGYSSLISEFAARFACSDDSAGAAAQPPGEGAADDAAPEADAAAHSLAAPSAAEAPPPAAGHAEQLRGTLSGASRLQAERGAEAECGPPGQQGSATGESPARQLRARRDPLLWFGALVPPHLRAGQVGLLRLPENDVLLHEVERHACAWKLTAWKSRHTELIMNRVWCGKTSLVLLPQIVCPLALSVQPLSRHASCDISILILHAKWCSLRMQADFATAAESAVHLANARQRLLAVLKRAEASCRAQAEEPPAAVQAAAHVVNGVSA